MPRHSESRQVPYRPEQLFDLVADVGRYPEFLPWCVGARVRSRTATEMVADLTIGFGPFRESFTSRVTLDRPGLIGVRYESGPFRYLTNQWRFEPDEAGCRVHFHVDFEFRSRLLQVAIGAVFHEAVRRMVAAFLGRARIIHGPPRPVPGAIRSDSPQGGAVLERGASEHGAEP
jgi:coenzyme Q-binding protein COQ10